MLNASDIYPELISLACSSEIIQFVLQSMGNTFKCSGIEYLRRYKKEGVSASFHTDAQLGAREIITSPGSHQIAIKVQLMLSDMNGNSCFKLIKGSHKWNCKNIAGVTNKQFESDALTVDINAGDAVFFSQRLIHGAGHHADQKNCRESLVFKYHQDWTTLLGSTNMETFIKENTENTLGAY